jgi:hypothetical protein
VKGSVVALLLLLGGVLLIRHGSVDESWAMMGFMATVVWFLVVGRRWYRSAVPTLVLCVLLVGVVNKPQTYLLVAKAAKADICPIVNDF